MIEVLKRRDQEEEYSSKVYKEGGYKDSFNNFFEFLIKYFNINELTKKYEECDQIISRNFLFYSSLEELNYLKYILKEIKNFIPLIFKLSQNFWLVDKLKKSNLKDESIIKMIENFVSLERTGRKRYFNHYTQEEFGKTIKKHEKAFQYYECEEKFDGITTGSILDYANLIKSLGLSKKDLLEFIGDFRWWINETKEWSRRTKYRFDKDIFKVEKSWDAIKSAFDNYDFWMDCLKEHEKT